MAFPPNLVTPVFPELPLMRLLIALCCTLALASVVRSIEPTPEEDLTTWVRLHIDEEMHLTGRPLECWFFGAEGEVMDARVRSVFAPNSAASFPLSFPSSSSSISSDGLSNINTTTTTATTLAPNVQMPSSINNFILSGGTATIGYRYDTGTEFVFDVRCLQGSRPEGFAYFCDPRLGWIFHTSLEEWNLSLLVAGRGLFTGSDINGGSATVVTTTTTNTVINGSDPVTFLPTQTSSTTITPISNTAGLHLTTTFAGGGGELGLGCERSFADTGLSAFAQLRAAGLYGNIASTTSYLANSGVQANSNIATSLLDVAGTVGVGYRAPFYAGLETRLGYSFENFFLLQNRGDAGIGSLLTGHSLFVALDLSF